MSSIYRDYRPGNFSEILGQNHIKLTLQNEILANKLGHSYLFCGPRAVGKTTTARILAKAINCTSRKEKEFEPCGKCNNCLSIKQGSNMDVLEIDAASNTGIDNVRENIISFSRLSPSNGKYKVFIIDEVHMLSTQAFNALLKIMEEPPSYVVFILCTTEIQKVPGTIISRCERFDFKKISLSETVAKLTQIAANEKISIEKEVLEAVAKKAAGYMRDAESLFGQILSIGGKKITKEQAELIIAPANDKEALNLISYLNKKDVAKAFSLINKLSDNGVNIKSFTNELIAISRRLLIDKVNPGLSDSLGMDLGESLEKDLVKINSSLSEAEIIYFLKKFMEALSENQSQAIPQLALEIAVTEICFNNISNKIDINKLQTTSSTNNVSVDSINTNSDKNIIQKEELQISNKEAGEEVKNSLELSNLSLAEVQAKWPEFLIKIKNKNHSLSFVLQSCRPQEIQDGNICLIFKYKFHQNRVNETDIREIVKSVLAEVYGAGLDFKTEIDENLKIGSNEATIVDDNEIQANNKQESANSGSLNKLLNAFGGEVLS